MAIFFVLGKYFNNKSSCLSTQVKLSEVPVTLGASNLACLGSETAAKTKGVLVFTLFKAWADIVPIPTTKDLFPDLNVFAIKFAVLSSPLAILTSIAIFLSFKVSLIPSSTRLREGWDTTFEIPTLKCSGDFLQENSKIEIRIK